MKKPEYPVLCTGMNGHREFGGVRPNHIKLFQKKKPRPVGGVLHWFFIPIILFLLPAGIQAGNVKNLDFVEYRIRAIYEDGETVSMPLYEQAEKYGICEYGCTLELIDTGQKIKMKPDDEIVIENGVMKHQEME